ncbi:hypothetical protein NUACC21_42380 [Scytonema sp. NUACC21]
MSIYFDANYYRSANKDLANFTEEQLRSHFQTFGLNEGRAFSPLVDLNFYRSSNSDLGGMNNQQLFDHLQNNGVAEGRRFSQFVDLSFYREMNKDLAAMNNVQLLEHLQNYGFNENRQYSQFFNPDYYLTNNPDLMQGGFNGKQLLEHFQFFGLTEGRKFNIALDVNYYRSVNSDLQAAGLSNKQLLEHFQLFGLTQGRPSSEAFNAKVYLANNSDLVAGGFNNQQAYMHFLVNGQKEGRPGSDYAGNSLDSARIVPQTTGTFTYTDFVGLGDTKDYYRLNLTSLTNATVELGNLTANVDFKVTDALGSVIATSSNSSTNKVGGTLEAGIYYIEVSSVGDSSAQYNITLTAASPLTTAEDIGTLGNTSTVKIDSVDPTTFHKFYKFKLNNELTTNAMLGDLTANADMQVIWDANKNGLVDSNDGIYSSIKSDTISEQLKGLLPAGDNYYIRVIPDATKADYKLTLSTALPSVVNYYDSSSDRSPGEKFLVFQSFGGSTETVVGDQSNITTNLVTTTSGIAGYGKYDTAVKLDRNTGYTLRFQIQLKSESHFGDNNGDKLDDNAGFNIIALSSDNKGIEIGFWNNEIWAKEFDSTSSGGAKIIHHDDVERAMFDTTVLSNYQLTILGDSYHLFANNSLVLKGDLRDYSTMGGNYSLQNHLFLGDSSSSAQADVNIKSILLTTATMEQTT